MSDPIRVFIGTEEKTEVARLVLEHSVRRHTKSPVTFTPMLGPAWEYPTDGVTVGTGFSLRRWMIPAACGWQGRAVYMDADQLVFDDVAELWAKPEAVPGEAGCQAWCTYQPDKFNANPWPQTSVMVIDCARARASGHRWGWHVDKVLEYLRANPIKEAYANFMHAVWMVPPAARVGDEWNHLNAYVPKGRPKHTRLLHYTAEDSQPWYKPDHPLAHLWHAALELAVKDGAVPKKVFEAALGRWGKKEDWRKQNGLHPYYRKYLPLFPG